MMALSFKNMLWYGIILLRLAPANIKSTTVARRDDNMSTFEYKVQSVRKAFNTGLYESALALALTLPDICAIIEYPNITLVGERYIKWSNSHIFIDNPSNVNENFAGAVNCTP